jgi:hypothetical protein
VHAAPDFENIKHPLDSPLASTDISTFVHSPDEVDAILPLPLSAAQDPARQHLHFFRLERHKPYWKIRAEDLVVPPMKDPLEVWGLSGWFFNLLAWRTGWLPKPRASEPNDWL